MDRKKLLDYLEQQKKERNESPVIAHAEDFIQLLIVKIKRGNFD